MMLGGDEIDRTQRGNNNRLLPGQRNLLVRLDAHSGEGTPAATSSMRMLRFRREHPIFHRRHFFHGRPIRGSDVKDIVWLKPDGGEMTDAEWREAHARCLGVYFSGEGLTETDERGRPLADEELSRALQRARQGHRVSSAGVRARSRAG